MTIWFVVLVVTANNISICLEVKVFYSMSIIYSSNKITAEFGRFKFTVGSDSNGE